MPQLDPADVPALACDNYRLLIFGIMLAALLQILDSTIANVAIPHMQSSLGATADTINWVLTSYIVASAVAMPITGWLAERIGAPSAAVISAVVGLATLAITWRWWQACWRDPGAAA